jgi:group I intron endonuclease
MAYKYYVYLHVKSDTLQPFYIGKGEGRRALRKQHRNQWWKNIVNKHGFNVILLEEDLTEDEAFNREVFWISIFGRKDLGKGLLVNLSDGGEGNSGHKFSEETKKKMSEALKGEKNPFYGKTHTDEWKKKNGELKKSNTNRTGKFKYKTEEERLLAKRTSSKKYSDKIKNNKINNKLNYGIHSTSITG